MSPACHAGYCLFRSFERAHFLLGDSERDDGLTSGDLRPVSRGDCVFVLTGLEPNDRNRAARRKLLDGGDETIVHRLEQGGRWNRMARDPLPT
jgi:hypothetical protein